MNSSRKIFTTEGVNERLHYMFNVEKRTKKYEKGPFPCGNCNLGKHTNCRPRMDGSLCTCDCPVSARTRLEYETEVEGAEAQGKEPMTLWDFVKVSDFEGAAKRFPSGMDKCYETNGLREQAPKLKKLTRGQKLSQTSEPPTTSTKKR